MANALWVGTRKGLFCCQRQHGRWSITRSEFLGVQVPMVLADRHSGQVFAALQHGHFGAKFHRSEDGSSWHETAVPTYPEKPDDVPETIDPMRNQPVPWSLELVWELAAAPSGRLWCGTIPGGLFYSDDRGESWDLLRSLWDVPERSMWFGGGYDYPGIHSVCIDPTDQRRLSVGVSCGGVWFSADNGETWEARTTGMHATYMPPDRAEDPAIQDPHLVAQCPSDPSTFWVQHHNGIFVTRDYGHLWSECQCEDPSSFGFAVASHPHDASTAWFVPAISDELRYPKHGKFVVTRTRDGGATFDVLTDGLPQQNAYHLVFRHALCVDDSGELLAMGSTTGGLWVSENGGDSWECLTQGLPPVYCVRFAS